MNVFAMGAVRCGACVARVARVRVSSRLSLTPLAAAYPHKGKSASKVWYDDVESLRAKIGYVDAQDLGGIGIWALGYDGDYEAPWLAIEQVLSDDEVTVPDIDAGASTDASTTPVDAGAATDGHGVDTWVSDNGPMLDESVSNGTHGSDNGQEPQGPSSSLSPVAQVTGMSAHSRQRTPIDDGCAMSAGSTPHSAWLCVLLALVTLGHRRRRASECSGVPA